MENKKIFFMWYDSYTKYQPWPGPWFVVDIDKIGKRVYHTLEELLELNISSSIKKKLKSAKIGTSIRMHYLHSCGDMMVKRIDEYQVEALNEIIEIDKKIESVQKIKNSLEEERKKVLRKVNIKKEQLTSNKL